jgi:UDP-GlcNAc:undecaprenyl-phosphate GlcNAc-1-phosphate transferase
MPAMLAALVSFAVAFAALRLLLSRFSRFVLDQPNARSLHAQPIPRTGGIAVLAGTGASLAFGAGELWAPLALALGLACVSFLDDLYRLPTLARLLAHLAAAAGLAWLFLAPIALPLAVVLVLAITWITNLYNFMDGADGLAGGMTLIGFGAYAVAALLAGDAATLALCAAVAAAAAAFLLHNFHPARIFLGDVGSIPLGFLAGALGVLGWRNGHWPLWFPLLVFAPFVGDATLTLLRRLARRERVWEAHREHYYQRMVRMGLGHRRTACVSYAAMVLCAGAALWGRAQGPAGQAFAFAGASLLLAGLAAWVDVKWGRAQATGRGPA